jgi:hypothetical protein
VNPAKNMLPSIVNRAIASGAPIIREMPTPEVAAFLLRQADDAWTAELVRHYGKQAGTKRYYHAFNGARPDAPGNLHSLYMAHREADAAWTASRKVTS